MITFVPIHTIPTNLTTFVEENAVAIRSMYGSPAAAQYRAQAPTAIAAAISSAQVHTWAAMEGTRALGLLYLLHEPRRTVLPYLHVLNNALGHGVEAALLDAAFQQELDADTPVVTDYVPLCDLDTTAVFRRHGFRPIQRQLMKRSLAHRPGIAPSERRSPLYPACTAGDLARVLSESYRCHPERSMFPEVHNDEEALAYISELQNGRFGPCPPEFVQIVRRDGAVAGIGLGVEARAGLGFVVHLAVLPSHRGQGLGNLVLEKLCGAFHDTGLTHVALGVTCRNPAAALYTRLGFETIQQFPVYHRGLNIPQT